MAKEFVQSTGIDILAPAVGNMHGLVKSMVQGQTKKRLDIDRIIQIKNQAQALLTLHGGSATDDEDLRKAIRAGINIVHINTELRVAWRRGMEEGLGKKAEEGVPYKILPIAVESVKQVALSRLRLFNADRAFSKRHVAHCRWTSEKCRIGIFGEVPEPWPAMSSSTSKDRSQKRLFSGPLTIRPELKVCLNCASDAL